MTMPSQPPSNDEYARLMESSAQLLDSLRIAISQVQQILVQMATLFRSMPSSDLYKELQIKVREIKEMGLDDVSS
jgi:hypothetical protein